MRSGSVLNGSRGSPVVGRSAPDGKKGPPGDVPDADHRGRCLGAGVRARGHRLGAGLRAVDERGDGRGRRVRAGLVSGLLHPATRLGSAIGISAVTAVYGLALGEAGDSGPEARLSAFRAALTVPVGMVVLGLLTSLLSVRAVRRASQVSSVNASQTSANPAQRSGGMASPK